MIVELATISILPGKEEQFVAALEQARQVLAQAEGWQGLAAHRGIERPSTFALILTWDTLEDHTVGFRGSDLFTQWRAILGPFFAEPPQVEHWTPL